MNYDKLAELPQFTVVNEYVPELEVGSGAPESEAQLERKFIRILESQGYEYLNTLTREDDLVANLRAQMEKLNRDVLKGGRFSDGEWRRFYGEVLANKKDHLVEKTRKFQEERRFDFTFDDGRHANLMIVDAEHLNNNTLQVINQYAEHAGAHEVRYDVTVLVNGLPAVHVELKKRGVAIREAFNQIKRYSRDGFWAGDALFEWVQVFVISNGTETKYYANTTRDNHLREMARAATKGGKKTSNSFEFTSYWADAKNTPIIDLKDFAKTFFAQQTLRNILVRYCVFTEEEVLMVMRPYQIAATERILERIRIASNRKSMLGTVKTCGNIVCFRNLEEPTNEAISLFGDKDAAGIVKIRTFEEYYRTGYRDGKGQKVKGYIDLIAELTGKFPLGKMVTGEANVKKFVLLFGEVLRRLNVLRVFDEFADDKAAKQILGDYDLQNYKSLYLDFYDQLRGKGKAAAENINDDIVFEMDTIRQFDVNIDYILQMVEQYHGANCRDKEVLGRIMKSLDASATLRPKRTLINAFIHSYNKSTGQANWAAFVVAKLSTDVAALSGKFGMDGERTYTYLTNALCVGSLATTGDDFDRILPPMSMFGGPQALKALEEKKTAIVRELQALFDEYRGVYVDLADSWSATPAEWWKSGRQGVPSPLPPGHCAYLILQSEFYDAIELGDKRVEFREVKPKYIPMFRDKKPVAVRLAYGYTTRQMIWEVEKVEEADGTFEIYLGKRLI